MAWDNPRRVAQKGGMWRGLQPGCLSRCAGGRGEGEVFHRKFFSPRVKKRLRNRFVADSQINASLATLYPRDTSLGGECGFSVP
jgi:hypothetical protein